MPPRPTPSRRASKPPSIRGLTAPRGNYVADFNFDGQGKWELVVSVEDEGESLTTVIPLQVEESSFTPSLGVQPPLTPNKTVQDVDDPYALTSSSMPDLGPLPA